MAYLDGDDLCRDCGACCHDVRDLRVTAAELERVPALAPHVQRWEGPFGLVDIDGPCPYLQPDGRCGTFPTRPYDCSLYPVNLLSIGRRRPDGSIQVAWMFTAQDCPERPEIVRRALRTGVDPVRRWCSGVLQAPVELVFVGHRWREWTALLLHRAGLLDLVRRLRGRPPLPRKPSVPR